MINLSNILEGIEKLAYDIILSILLVPKTLIKVIFEPAWVPDYVSQELKQKEEKRFDEYVSPVLFMILIALAPYIYYTTASQPEVVVRGPAEGTVAEAITFSAEADFISKTPPYEFVWYTEGTGFKENRIDHLFNDETFVWETSGNKLLHLKVTNSKGETRGSRPFYIQIRDAGESVSNIETSSLVSKTAVPETLFFNYLQGSSTIIIMFYLLSIPLLFALAGELFQGHPLSRTLLRRSFYIQCYYVSPVYLALWSMSLGIALFSIASEWFFMYFVGGGFMLMVIWLGAVETGFLSKERGIGKWKAFAIVLMCLSITTIIIFTIELAYDQPEFYRMSMWGFFITLVMGIFISNIIRIAKKRRQTSRMRLGRK